MRRINLARPTVVEGVTRRRCSLDPRVPSAPGSRKRGLSAPVDGRPGAVYPVTMRFRVALAIALAAGASLLAAPAALGQAPGLRDSAPPLSRQVHYLGRDPLTGLAAMVGDHYIAAVEESFERYYDEDREPVPPPPAEGLDVTAIAIPAIGVRAPVGRYGIDAAGRLDVPQDRSTVGWNPAYSDVPGTGGATFFAAHYEYGGIPGVFHALSSLREGGEITVTLSDGSERHYRVTSTVDYALAAIDMGAILAGREGVESITLMTCSGPGDGGRYPLRTVVLAEAVE